MSDATEQHADGSPDGFELRLAQPTDAVAVAGLWTRVYLDSGLVERTEPFGSDEVTAILTSSAVCLAVDSDRGVVGAIVLARKGEPGANIAVGDRDTQVLRLAVDDSARGAGVGRALVGWTIDAAVRAGSDALWLSSRPNQQPAHRLYESLGFARVDDPDPQPRPADRLVYRLTL